MTRITKVLLALAAATASVAGAGVTPPSNPVDVTISLVALDDGLHAIVKVSSPTRLPLSGKLGIQVNGRGVLDVPLETSDKVVVDQRLGVLSGSVTACATFRGTLETSGSLTSPVSDSACALRVGLVRPGLPGQSRPAPGLPR